MPEISQTDKNQRPNSPGRDAPSAEPVSDVSELDQWAAYYDFIHQGLPGEAEYYVREAVRCGGDVLELGCGTGRICIPMAMTGVRVVGVDISAEMLQVCRKKQRRVGPVRGFMYLVRADMRAFAFSRQFRLIVMPYRTFMHLLTPLDQIRTLRCVRRHLDEDGAFLLNMWAARPSTIAHAVATGSLNTLQLAGEYPMEEEGAVLMHYHAARYDEFRQLILERHLIQTVDARGKVRAQQELSLTRAWLSPREMEHLAVRCGFRVEGTYGDFDESPLDEHSTEMIWRLRRW